MENKIEFKKFMAAIGTIYSKDPDPLMPIYWKVLEPYTDQQCFKAFGEVLATSSFFPAPAEIVNKISGPQKLNLKKQAREAWDLALDVMSGLGSNESVKFQDTRMGQAIEVIGGWIGLGMSEIKDHKYIRREFFEAYQEADPEIKPKTLVGRFNGHPHFIECEWMKTGKTLPPGSAMEKK